jgi:hypothetical protein
MLRVAVWSLKTEAHALSPRTFGVNLNFSICMFVLDFFRGFIRNVSRGTFSISLMHSAPKFSFFHYEEGSSRGPKNNESCTQTPGKGGNASSLTDSSCHSDILRSEVHTSGTLHAATQLGFLEAYEGDD